MRGSLHILILSTGWGFLVLPILFGCMLGTSFLFPLLVPTSALPKYADLALGLILASALLWPLGRWLNRDKDCWEQHTFFFIPIQICAPLSFLLGLLVLLTQ